MQETKDAMSIDAMQKTKTTMNDASECVPPTPCGSHTLSRMRTHAAKRAASLPAKQNPLPMCRVLKRPPRCSPDHPLASLHAPTHRSWQQVMLARLGIDKTKSWADRVEEEEELAQLTKTLDAAAKPPPDSALALSAHGQLAR